jgi:phosphoglycolate phosphatase
MIGDSEVDILTARNCAARSIGCSYGLAPQSLAAAAPDAIVDSPVEWLAVLGQFADAAMVR